jgi:predicted transcriptional regulator
VALDPALAKVGLMISPRQIKAARALLGWSQRELADRAIVSPNALTRLEKGQVDSRMSTLDSVEKALRKGGIEFIAAGDKGEGVRLLAPS